MTCKECTHFDICFATSYQWFGQPDAPVRCRYFSNNSSYQTEVQYWIDMHELNMDGDRLFKCPRCGLRTVDAIMSNCNYCQECGTKLSLKKKV